MKNETKILNLFVGNDKYIPALNQAFKQGDMVCATDAITLITIPISLIGLRYPYQDKPDVSSVLNIRKECHKIIELSWLKELYHNVPIINETYKCEACAGTGMVDYEFYFNGTTYTEEEECPVCRGEGHLGETGEMIKDPQYDIDIHGNPFKSGRVLKMINLMKLLEITSCVLVSNPSSEPNLFRFENGINVILMPSLK
jgi:hypothetical protein